MTQSPAPIRRRIVAHFPGFEPLDAQAHRDRYARSAAQSGAAFGFSVETHPLAANGAAPHFDVGAHGPNWQTQTQVFVLGHIEILTKLKSGSLPSRLWRGCRAAFAVVAEGGFWRYMKVSWRFGLFFLGPFVLFALGFAAAAALAFMPLLYGLSPWHLLWSFSAAAFLFVFAFLPWTERTHIQHMFADWELAVKLARLNDPAVNALLESHAEALAAILRQPADEHLITSHSLGGMLAAHALGLVLERHGEEFAGKKLSFVTLAGPALQSSLLSSAKVLRARIRTILESPDVFWMDVQCLTDIVSFYKGRAARDNGHTDLPEPHVADDPHPPHADA